MASMRRGLAPIAVEDDPSDFVKAGSMASRKGSESMMPVPRKKRRREIDWRVVIETGLVGRFSNVARASSPAGRGGVPPVTVVARGETPRSLAGEDARATLNR